MPPSSQDLSFASPGALADASVPLWETAPPRRRLFDLLMAPFRDIDTRVSYVHDARRREDDAATQAAKRAASRSKASRR